MELHFPLEEFYCYNISAFSRNYRNMTVDSDKSHAGSPLWSFAISKVPYAGIETLTG